MNGFNRHTTKPGIFPFNQEGEQTLSHISKMLQEPVERIISLLQRLGSSLRELGDRLQIRYAPEIFRASYRRKGVIRVFEEAKKFIETNYTQGYSS